MTTEKARIASSSEQYRASNPRSGALYERAVQALPGGNTRTTLYVQPYPFYFERGQGCFIYDVDGNARLDFINNYTSLILGHGHPRVIAAVQEQLLRGVSAAAPSELEIQLAEVIKERLPSIDLLRFTNSGTEATMLAIRAARAYSGRTLIAKFEGGYHGSHDYAAVAVSAGGAVGAGQVTANAGIPDAVVESMVTLPFNDPAGVERIVTAYKDELAAVIVEPVVGAGGVIAPAPGFLELLRDLTHRHGMLLIFDEVISFRIAYHGAQGYFGVRPDLTTLGKIIGGGLPIGAVGGAERVMACFDPRRDNHIGHGGTFNANPLSMAAGLATLAEMTPAAYERLGGLAEELRWKLLGMFQVQGVAAQVNQVGSLFNIHLSATPVTSYSQALQADRRLLNELYLAALNEGVAFTARGMGCLSTPMTSREVDVFVGALDEALARVLAAA